MGIRVGKDKVAFKVCPRYFDKPGFIGFILTDTRKPFNPFDAFLYAIAADDF